MKKLILLVLALVLTLSLAACGGAEGVDINIAVLSGPTGVGAVGLMESNDKGESTNHYNFTVVGANDQITTGLSNGEFDIAAVATNLAATYYNKTSGSVEVIALNTYGVLYILERGDTIKSVADLRGKTIYCAGQAANPEYVLKHILSSNGLTYEGDNADVELVFEAPDAISAKMAAGEIDVCMLPVPAATGVLIQNSDVRSALDLTAEWDALGTGGKLTMGCVVVRREFAEEHPEAVKSFLEEYADSIETVLSDVDHAAQLCESYGIVPKAAVAKRAIPDCNICCVTGADIRVTLEPYYEVLFAANPDSIGGALPDDSFYYVG